MQVIGFGLNKVSAEKFPEFTRKTEIETNIEFKDLSKQEVSIIGDNDALKIDFIFTISYNLKEAKKKKKGAELIFDGHVLLSAEKDASKEIQKHWKKKDLPNGFKVPLFNIILQRCTVKALQLEEELNLPTHFPLPRLKGRPKQEDSK